MVSRAQPFRGSARFEVVAQVGQGGAGFVYEAIDRESNARVAVKTLRTRDAESLLHLKDEFRVIHDLSHPNLVTPKELIEENGQWFFTMDFVEGTDFLSYVRPASENRSAPTTSEPTLRIADAASGERAIASITQDGTLDEERLRAALAQLTVGLCALHASHKVHRDVKPSNVLVTPQGRVMILDFGIVSDLTDRAVAREDGVMVGTVLYMAPEQADGGTVTPAADWYAVGVMLYQALTGRLPFVGGMTEVLTQKISAEPPPVAKIAPEAPGDLAALATDLLRTDPARRPDGAEIMARLGIPRAEAASADTTIRFVGRRSELAMLEAAFATIATGERTGVTFLLEGESGVGKSVLVREFTRRAEARHDALVFRGRCYERASVPYKAVDSLIDDLARYLAALPESEMLALLPARAAALCKLFPVLETLALPRDTGSLDVKNPAEARARTFDVARELFTNIARSRRLILAIDDLQWADADSLALLREVLRPPDAPPLLLLASIRTATERTRRDEGVQGDLARLPGDVRRAYVTPLPAVDARELVQSLLHGRAANDVDADVEAILSESKGHPLFIDELVRHRAHHAGAAARLDEALWERAARLPPSARKLLELIAVAGAPLAQEIVGQAAALDPAQVFDAVSSLRTAHFVRTSGVYKTDTVEAYHDRVRESVLKHLDDVTRKEHNGRLALALENVPHADPERLAMHWQGAGNSARAAEHALHAADEAAAAFAFDHAASLYAMALDLRPTLRDDEARDLKVKLAEALTNAGRSADAGRAYLDAAGDGHSNRAIDLRRRAGEELVCSGHIDEGRATFESVLAEMHIRAARTPFAIIASLLLASIVLAVRGLGFRRRDEKDIDPRVLLRLDCMFSAGCSLGMADHVRAKEMQLRTFLEALRVGEPSRVARAMAYYAAGHVSAGVRAFDATMRMQANVAAMAKELHQPFLEGMALLVAGYAHHLTGRFKDARVYFERAEIILRERCVGVAYEIASGRALLFRALVALGALPELARRAEAALREALDRRDLYSVVNIRTNAMSLLAVARDDADGAQRELDLAGQHLAQGAFHVQHWFHFMAQQLVTLYRGDAARVRDALIAIRPTIRRSLLLKVQTLRVPTRDLHARACIAMIAAGAPNAAALRREAAREATALEREHMPWALAHAHVLRAGLDELAGDRAHALEHLASADAIFTELGVELHANIVRRRRGILLGDARLREDAETWMAAQGIESAAKICALYVPGFPE